MRKKKKYDCDKKKTYIVSTIVESSNKQLARGAIEKMGLIVWSVDLVDNKRTPSQNNSLHLFFSQLADELNKKGLDMRSVIRPEIELSWTGYSVKEFLWKPLQKVLTGKKSTTKLDKSKDINLIYDNLNRILTERTKGEVRLPPFPSILIHK